MKTRYCLVCGGWFESRKIHLAVPQGGQRGPKAEGAPRFGGKGVSTNINSRVAPTSRLAGPLRSKGRPQGSDAWTEMLGVPLERTHKKQCMHHPRGLLPLATGGTKEFFHGYARSRDQSTQRSARNFRMIGNRKRGDVTSFGKNDMAAPLAGYFPA